MELLSLSQLLFANIFAKLQRNNHFILVRIWTLFNVYLIRDSDSESNFTRPIRQARESRDVTEQK